MTIVQLSDSSESMVSKLGAWQCMAMGTGTYRNSIPVGSTNYTINLGASYSQLLGITFVQTLANQDHAATHTGTSFHANNVNRWSLSIDGVLVENQRMIYANEPAELVALNCIQKGYLAKLTDVPINLGSAVVESSNNPQAIFSQDLSIFKRSCGGFGDYDEAFHCAGRSTLSSTTNVNLEFKNSADTDPVAFTLFSKFTQLISYDPEMRMFRVSQ